MAIVPSPRIEFLPSTTSSYPLNYHSLNLGAPSLLNLVEVGEALDGATGGVRSSDVRSASGSGNDGY